MDLRAFSYFLRVEVIPHKQGLFLYQMWYIIGLLNCTFMTASKPVATLLASSLMLTLHSGFALTDPIEYCTIVGSLQYLSLTRPNIAFTVNKLSQFMHCLITVHWTTVKHLLHFLCGLLVMVSFSIVTLIITSCILRC